MSNQVFTADGDVVTQGIYNALRDAHATLADRCQEQDAEIVKLRAANERLTNLAMDRGERR